MEGFGAVGLQMDKEDGSDENICEMFQKADRINTQDKKTVVVNVLIGKSKFREGSISV